MRIVLCLFATFFVACASTGSQSGKPPEVRFVGNASFSASRLKSALSEELDGLGASSMTKANADDLAYETERFYRARGFASALCDYEFEQRPGSALVTITVDEGPRTEIGTITLEGITAFEEKDILAFFEKHRSGLFGDGPLYFVESQVRDGFDELRSVYFSRGFQEAVVAPPELSFSDDRTRVDIVVRVVEGSRHVLRSVTPLDDERLQKAAQPALDQPFTPRVAQSIRARLLDAYGREGHADCRATFETSVAANGAVALAYTIEPGVQVRIKAVEVTGNDKTTASFIKTRVDIEAGSTFDSDKLREAFSRLYESALFKRVTIDLVEESGSERTLRVHVEEAPTRELFVEPGYGSYERARLTVGGIDRNIFGSGRSLSAETTVGGLAQSATVAYADPWFLESEYAASASIFYNDREEPSYTLGELGTTVGLSRRFEDHFEASLTYQFRQTELSDVDVTAPDPDIVSDVDISSIAISVQRDSRNSILVATEGTQARVTTEFASSALGSELDFVRTSFTTSRFHALSDVLTFGASVRTGVIWPIENTDEIPLQTRYFNGGENTVRSFREDELGPLDMNGEPVGGEAYTVLSVELRRRLIGSLTGAFFVDTGNTVLDHNDYLDFDGFRSGIGVGLRYMLPIGPLRLDGAVNPESRPGEDDYVIHLSVGMAF